MGFKTRIILAIILFAVALTSIFMFVGSSTMRSLLLAITVLCTLLFANYKRPKVDAESMP